MPQLEGKTTVVSHNEHELSILQKLNKEKVPNIPNIIGSHDSTLILQPYASSFDKTKMKQSSVILMGFYLITRVVQLRLVKA